MPMRHITFLVAEEGLYTQDLAGALNTPFPLPPGLTVQSVGVPIEEVEDVPTQVLQLAKRLGTDKVRLWRIPVRQCWCSAERTCLPTCMAFRVRNREPSCEFVSASRTLISTQTLLRLLERALPAALTRR